MIEPFYFVPNIDEVLKKHGIVIDTKRHKPFQYFKILTTNYERIIQIFKTLDKRESNIGVLFDYLENLK